MFIYFSFCAILLCLSGEFIEDLAQKQIRCGAGASREQCRKQIKLFLEFWLKI